VGKRHRRIRAQSATGQVAGAATEKPGLKHPSSNNRPAQHAFPHEPLSRSPDPNGQAPHSSPGRHFHAPTSAPGSARCCLMLSAGCASGCVATGIQVVGGAVSLGRAMGPAGRRCVRICAAMRNATAPSAGLAGPARMMWTSTWRPRARLRPE